MSIDSFSADLDLTVVVVVDSYAVAPPKFNADNDIDYYGYVECEWHLEDDKGNKLTQLEVMLSEKQIQDIEGWIDEHMQAYYHSDGPEPDDFDDGYYDGRYDP